VIRILFGSRLVRSARRLPAQTREKAEAVLRAVAESFGNPHAHSGLGLRKLGPRTWECRIDIHWRIVFIEEADGLRAYDIMDHDEIRAWLKSHHG
jgi:hypothetical protein